MTTDSPTIDLCFWYHTDGWPDYRPMCTKGRKASLKCHSNRPDCPDYKKSLSPKGPRYAAE